MFRSENSRLFVVGFVAGMILFGGCNTSDYSDIEKSQRISELERENEKLKKQVAQLGADDGSISNADNQDMTPSPDVDKTVTANTSKIVTDPGKTEKAPEVVSGMTLEEEQSAVAELENNDVFFDFDDAGYVIEADFKECREVNSLLEKSSDFSKLKKILLDGNRCDSDTFKHLAKCASVEYLDLERSNPSAEDMAQLKDLPNLSFLQLFKATLSEEACEAISGFPAVEQVRCAQTRVGDAELVHLSKIKTLRAIDLSDCNRVTPAGLELLAKGCPKLAFLKVWGKSIGNSAMDTVAGMKSLRVLGLVDTAVDDEGIKKLAGLNLSEVHLFRTSVGDEGIKVLADMPNMSTLNLRDTKISDAAMESITKLKKLRKLDLSECTSPGITDVGADSIAKIESLQQLNLWATKVTDAGVAKFEGMENLTWLNLDACNVTDESAKVCGRMKQLAWIHLGKTKITDASVEFLKGLENLRYLDISNTSISNDKVYDLIDALDVDCELIGP